VRAGAQVRERYTLAALEGMAPIPPVRVTGGSGLRMGCPFHGSDTQRSLSVNLVTGRYGCFACDAWGYLADVGRDRIERARQAAPVPFKRRLARPRPAPAVSPFTPIMPSPTLDAGAAERLARYMEAARRHLGDADALTYLRARCIPVDLAWAYGLGFFPPGMWPGRPDARQVGRIGFPLQAPDGALIGIASRAVDPDYPRTKAPKAVRHDTFGRRGLFNTKALTHARLFLTEGAVDALAMLASGYNAAALIGSNGKLPWSAMGAVHELFLCLDQDEAGERDARSLAYEAAVHGVNSYIPEPGAYGGYGEPSTQFEAEGVVSLAGAPPVVGELRRQERILALLATRWQWDESALMEALAPDYSERDARAALALLEGLGLVERDLVSAGGESAPVVLLNLREDDGGTMGQGERDVSQAADSRT
jgi:hypothetical protein